MKNRKLDTGNWKNKIVCHCEEHKLFMCDEASSVFKAKRGLFRRVWRPMVPRNDKLFFILLIVVLLAPSFVFAEDNIFQRVFFKDYENLGAAICADPLKSSIIFAAMAGATIYIYNNENYMCQQIKQKNDFKDKFFDIMNYGGDAISVLAANSLFFLGGEKEKKTGEKVIESLAVGGIITELIKYSAGRERPSDGAHDVFRPFSGNESFFSGHTAVAFSWAAIIGDNYRIGYITYPLAACVAIARINKNAHWPSDVLWAAFTGTLCAKVINAGDSKPVSFLVNREDDTTKVLAEYKF